MKIRGKLYTCIDVDKNLYKDIEGASNSGYL
jgi:hypothetical protein